MLYPTSQIARPEETDTAALTTIATAVSVQSDVTRHYDNMSQLWAYDFTSHFTSL